jgi:hypothetical protein
MEIIEFARLLNFDHRLVCESRQRYRNWTFSVLGCSVGMAISQRGPTERTVFSRLSSGDKNRLGIGHFAPLSRNILITSLMYLLQHNVEMNVVG